MLTDEEAAALAQAYVGHDDMMAVLADRRERIEREAQTQATLAQTREALAGTRDVLQQIGGEDVDSTITRTEAAAMLHACNRASAALALPQDRTALDAALAAARRQGARAATRRCVAVAHGYDGAACRCDECVRGIHGPRLDAVVTAIEAEVARIEAGK